MWFWALTATVLGSPTASEQEGEGFVSGAVSEELAAWTRAINITDSPVSSAKPGSIIMSALTFGLLAHSRAVLTAGTHHHFSTAV